MDCVILGRVVDSFSKNFIGSDGKEVSYQSISMIDEDAFLDSDRVFVVRVNPDKIKGLELIGKDWKFKGTLTKDKGLLKFRVSDILEVK
jgi:hypothetical protein